MQASLHKAITLRDDIEQVILPNPVNLETVDSAIAKAIASPPSDPTYRITLCGRLIPLKRIELLLAALARLDRRRNWQLDILGDGPLRQELSLDAESLGLAERVRFHGNVPNPYAYFARADLGVLCSTIEGFPNVLLEMMASGTKMIISTPCTPAVRELPDVAILEDANADALVALIARSMDSRPDLSARYRAHVEQAHSIEGFVQTVVWLGAAWRASQAPIAYAFRHILIA